MRQRHALIARVMQMRGGGATGATQPASDTSPQADGLGGLEARIAHLEQLVEGLQDSVHRQFERHSKQITDLETQIEPSALAVALSKDARQRGL